MTRATSARQVAFENLDKKIRKDMRFPQNVFIDQWKEFLFFDPDWIFEGAFVEKAKSLIQIEDASSVGLCNLDLVANNSDSPRFDIDKATEPEDFQAFLTGPSAWIHRMERYVSVSDKGSWCIYCERNNDLAVIALRTHHDRARLNSVLNAFYALPISDAVRGEPIYSLSPRGSAEAFRQTLLKEYGPGDLGV